MAEYYFGTDDTDASVGNVVKYLVVLNDSAMPTVLPTNTIFEKRLTNIPSVGRSASDVKVNISGLGSTRLVFSNTDGFFNDKEIEGWFASIWKVDSVQTNLFKGVITEWCKD